MLEAAGRVGRLVLQIDVDAIEGRHPELEEMRIRGAALVGIDGGDRAVDPCALGAGRRTSRCGGNEGDSLHRTSQPCDVAAIIPRLCAAVKANREERSPRGSRGFPMPAANACRAGQYGAPWSPLSPTRSRSAQRCLGARARRSTISTRWWCAGLAGSRNSSTSWSSASRFKRMSSRARCRLFNCSSDGL